MSRDDEIGRFCGLKKKVAPLCGFGEYGDGARHFRKKPGNLRVRYAAEGQDGNAAFREDRPERFFAQSREHGCRWKK